MIISNGLQNLKDLKFLTDLQATILFGCPQQYHKHVNGTIALTLLDDEMPGYIESKKKILKKYQNQYLRYNL